MSQVQTNMPNYRWRKLVDWLMRGLTVLATAVAIIPLLLISFDVLWRGGQALNLEFFTQTYQPPLIIGAGLGEVTTLAPSASPLEPVATPPPGATADPFAHIDIGDVAELVGAVPADESGAGNITSGVVARGGILHGIIGTILVAGVALLISIPVGIMAGVFLSEYPNNAVATSVRFCTDVLSGAPSIVVGVVAYILLVVPSQRYSGLAGSVALAMLMLPTITRTTEEMLKLVPESVREAAMALGAPTWYATFTVVIPTALNGILTGIMLAFARGAGETAPLLLTILGSNLLTADLRGPIGAMPLLIYRYTESPFPSENTLAWGTAFVLMMVVLVTNILARLLTRQRMGR